MPGLQISVGDETFDADVLEGIYPVVDLPPGTSGELSVTYRLPRLRLLALAVAGGIVLAGLSISPRGGCAHVAAERRGLPSTKSDEPNGRLHRLRMARSARHSQLTSTETARPTAPGATASASTRSRRRVAHTAGASHEKK